MKVYYNDKKLESKLRDIFNKSEMEVSLTYCIPPKQLMEEMKKIGGGVGFAPPEGWVDLGGYVVSFVLTNPISQGVLGSAIWDTFKKCFALLKQSEKKKETNLMELVVVTDQYGINNFHKTVCFVVDFNLSDEDLEKAVNTIPKVREKLMEFLTVADITGTLDTITLKFVFGRWCLNHFNQQLI